MGMKLCPKLIFEGSRLTGKTELAFALNSHPRVVGPRKYAYHSPLISAEWCAFTNTPWGRGLINFEPDEEARALEAYATWLRLFELLRYYSWMIDRFHWSTRLYQMTARGREFDTGWIEERLAPLGFRIILCTRRTDTFEAARIERLKVSGNPSQYDNLQPFIEDQTLLLQYAKESRLPVMQLDVSDHSTSELADKVADWLEDTGGLYDPGESMG
jgi:hypothetical protein